MPARPLLVAALVAIGAGGCGGKVAPSVDALDFAPQQLSAGYGFTSGMEVRLVDPTSDQVLRRLSVTGSELSGSFSIAGGTLQATLFEQRTDGTTLTYDTVSGTVSMEPASGGPQGSVTCVVDVVFAAPHEPGREYRITGSYVAPLEWEG